MPGILNLMLSLWMPVTIF